MLLIKDTMQKRIRSSLYMGCRGGYWNILITFRDADLSRACRQRTGSRWIHFNLTSLYEGHEHYDAAIHLFSAQSTGAVENITMGQTIECYSERNIEINEIEANKTCEHLGVEQSFPNHRGSELELINDNVNGDENPCS
jgi:hypothetical protein